MKAKYHSCTGLFILQIIVGPGITRSRGWTKRVLFIITKSGLYKYHC